MSNMNKCEHNRTHHWQFSHNRRELAARIAIGNRVRKHYRVRGVYACSCGAQKLGAQR